MILKKHSLSISEVVFFLSLYSISCCHWCEPFFFTFGLFTFTYAALYGPPKQLICLISALRCWILTLSTLCTLWFSTMYKISSFPLVDFSLCTNYDYSFCWSLTLRRLCTLSFLLPLISHITYTSYIFFVDFPLCAKSGDSFLFDILLIVYFAQTEFHFHRFYIVSHCKFRFVCFSRPFHFSLDTSFCLHILFIQLVPFISKIYFCWFAT